MPTTLQPDRPQVIIKFSQPVRATHFQIQLLSGTVWIKPANDKDFAVDGFQRSFAQLIIAVLYKNINACEFRLLSFLFRKKNIPILTVLLLPYTIFSSSKKFLFIVTVFNDKDSILASSIKRRG